MRQLKRERLVHEFWETMERPGAQLVALSSNLSVPNYPRRRVQESQQHVFSQVSRHFLCVAWSFSKFSRRLSFRPPALSLRSDFLLR